LPRYAAIGHYHDSEIRPYGCLQPPNKRQGEVAIEVTFVKLIQDHYAGRGQTRVGQETPVEDAFRKEVQPRPRPGDFFETDPVAYTLA